MTLPLNHAAEYWMLILRQLAAEKAKGSQK